MWSKTSGQFLESTSGQIVPNQQVIEYYKDKPETPKKLTDEQILSYWRQQPPTEEQLQEQERFLGETGPQSTRVQSGYREGMGETGTVNTASAGTEVSNRSPSLSQRIQIGGRIYEGGQTLPPKVWSQLQQEFKGKPTDPNGIPQEAYLKYRVQTRAAGSKPEPKDLQGKVTAIMEEINNAPNPNALRSQLGNLMSTWGVKKSEDSFRKVWDNIIKN